VHTKSGQFLYAEIIQNRQRIICKVNQNFSRGQLSILVKNRNYNYKQEVDMLGIDGKIKIAAKVN